MRNTRTLAACVAATTLFGLLSATPALAAPLDRGDVGMVQGDESGRAGLGLLGRSATEVPAVQADRGAAGTSDDQQPGGPGAGLLVRSPRDAPAAPTPSPTPAAPTPTPTPAAPTPTSTAIAPTPAAAATEPASVPTSAEAAPGAASSAQPPLVIATLSDEGVLVSLSDELYRSEKRIVVIVEGKPVAQIQNKQTRGVTRVVPDVVAGRSLLYIPGVKPGDRMAVTEYAGSLDDGFDDSLRRTRVYAAQLGDAFPASTP